MEPSEFVDMVWLSQDCEGYGFVSMRDRVKANYWTELHFEVPGRIEVPDFDDIDLYFCPNLFSVPHRRKEYMLPSVWLYADLDEVSPFDIETVPPTVVWETSKGRWQAMWQCPIAMEPSEHQIINKRLTYMIGADKGGWDATQVLRIPGTRNYKYDEQPEVKLVWIS
jgi:hypothetical protein